MPTSSYLHFSDMKLSQIKLLDVPTTFKWRDGACIPQTVTQEKPDGVLSDPLLAR